MHEFDPATWGYKPEDVKSYKNGWIVFALNLPVIACDDDNIWYCPINQDNEMRLSA